MAHDDTIHTDDDGAAVEATAIAPLRMVRITGQRYSSYSE